MVTDLWRGSLETKGSAAYGRTHLRLRMTHCGSFKTHLHIKEGGGEAKENRQGRKEIRRHFSACLLELKFIIFVYLGGSMLQELLPTPNHTKKKYLQFV